MKNQSIILLVIILISRLLGCFNNELPSSIRIKENRVYFLLRDHNYKSVSFGSNILGKWQNKPMKKVDSLWVVSFINPKRSIEYKFLIDNEIWMRDPLNNRKVKLPPGFKGFNSYFEF